MSTRCQIGFYETPDQDLLKPSALLYRHSDGYPEGVLPELVPYCKQFDQHRGMGDVEYLAARTLQHLMNGHDDFVATLPFASTKDFPCLGYGISDDFHGDLEYYYAVYGTGTIVVYEVSYDWKQDGAIRLRELKTRTVRQNIDTNSAAQDN